jgi:hypothetical protein
MTSLSANLSAGDMMESPLHHHVAHTNHSDERGQVSWSSESTWQP